jgi:tRNA pseudouridine55 synthase
MPKRYTGTFLLGRQSATEDVDGEVTALDDPPVPDREQIVLAARRLTGKIEQRPPAYSALRVDGHRAHALARQGHEVELKPRPVVVHRLEVLAYDYPELQLEIECGSGTYVRSLGRDLAESLGTAAVMSGLVRTAIGSLVLDEAVDPSTLSRDEWTSRLLPPERAVELLPRIELNSEEIVEIRAGRSIERSASSCGTGDVAAFDAAGRLLSILVPRGAGLLGPTLNLPAGE